jgi:hypothetical protein
MQEPEPTVPKALGPGDDDPRFVQRGVPREVSGPLAPGEDQPTTQERITTAGDVRGPLKPGETDPSDTRPPFQMFVPPQAGPGGVAMPPRRITVFPIDPKE